MTPLEKQLDDRIRFLERETANMRKVLHGLDMERKLKELESTDDPLKARMRKKYEKRAIRNTLKRQ